MFFKISKPSLQLIQYRFGLHEMLALKVKLKKFQFYRLPKGIQNIIKKVVCDYSNKTSMKDASFLVTKI